MSSTTHHNGRNNKQGNGVMHRDELKASDLQAGQKRHRSDSLEAEAAQTLTQLDHPLASSTQREPLPPHLHHNHPHPIQEHIPVPAPIMPAANMHPTQYANAFSAGPPSYPPHRPAYGPDGGFMNQMHPSSIQRAPGGPLAGPMGPGGQAGTSPQNGRAPGTPQARQRTAVACRYCRKRKIRCTGISHDPNDPRCSNCRRLDQECIYAPVGAPTQGSYQMQGMPMHNGGHDPYAQQRGPAGYQQGMIPEQHPQWQGQMMRFQPPPPPQQQHLGGPPIHSQPPYMHEQSRPYSAVEAQYGYRPNYAPHGQHYQYDSSYPTYAHEPNAGPQGAFGRLKPETFAVYPPPSAPQLVVDPAHNVDNTSPRTDPPMSVASVASISTKRTSPGAHEVALPDPKEQRTSESPKQIPSISNITSTLPAGSSNSRTHHDDAMLSRLLNPTEQKS